MNVSEMNHTDLLTEYMRLKEERLAIEKSWEAFISESTAELTKSIDQIQQELNDRRILAMQNKALRRAA